MRSPIPQIFILFVAGVTNDFRILIAHNLVLFCIL